MREMSEGNLLEENNGDELRRLTWEAIIHLYRGREGGEKPHRGHVQLI